MDLQTKTKSATSNANIITPALEANTTRKRDRKMAEKKYYWLKLQKDFFKRHDIRIVEGMDNGKDYVLFYLKLLLESIDHEGSLRFSETIPYNDKMLATITNTNIDIVRSAMEVFTQLGMIEILDDATIFMTETNKMLGCETEWAKKKREYRLKKDNERTLSLPSPCDVRQEIDIEKELEIEININSASDNAPSVKKSDINDFFEKVWKLYPNKKGKGQISDSKKKVLYEVGIDEMTRAIERYKTDLAKEDWRKPQNGSTFFNSGYVDYLDANYEPLKVKATKPTNKFNSFEQRQYSKEHYDNLERMILGM